MVPHHLIGVEVSGSTPSSKTVRSCSGCNALEMVTLQRLQGVWYRQGCPVGASACCSCLTGGASCSRPSTMKRRSSTTSARFQTSMTAPSTMPSTTSTCLWTCSLCTRYAALQPRVARKPACGWLFCAASKATPPGFCTLQCCAQLERFNMWSQPCYAVPCHAVLCVWLC